MTDISALPEGALHGVNVVEAGLLVQGPQAAALLGQMGASVTKVELPGFGDQARWLPISWEDRRGPYFLACNRGKRSVAIDLRVPAGKDAFLRVVDRADVLITNFMPGTMESWGLGYEEVSARQRNQAGGLRELDVEADERRDPAAGEFDDELLLALHEAGVRLRGEEMRLAVDAGDGAVRVDADSRVAHAPRRSLRETKDDRSLHLGCSRGELTYLRPVNIHRQLVEVTIRVAAQVQLREDREVHAGMRPDRIDGPRHVPRHVANPACKLREQRLHRSAPVGRDPNEDILADIVLTVVSADERT